MGRDGAVVAFSQKRHETFHPQPGWVEQDPKEIWANTFVLIREVLSKLPTGDKLDAVGIANQGETVLLWDRDTGEPLWRALVWQDLRTRSWMEELRKEPTLQALVRSRTGLSLDPYFSAPKIRWLLDHAPKSDRLCVGTMDSWLIWNLTKGSEFVTDSSTASRTLLFDIHKKQYDEKLLRLFGIPRGVLPQVKRSTSEFGTVAGFGPRLDGARIRANLVDQPAALWGHGCVNPGETKATYGTGCFVYMNMGERVALSEHGLLTSIAWETSEKTTYALDGGVFAAGSVIQWLMDTLGFAASEEDLEELAADLDSGEVICVPALVGLASPHWKRNARAAWLGMDAGTTKANLVRAAFEGIALRVGEVVKAMELESGIEMKSLRVDGGLSASKTLMQIQADCLGIPVEVSSEQEATLRGACFAAMGIKLPKNKAAVVHEPRISKTEREQKIERFKKAVRLVVEFE